MLFCIDADALIMRMTHIGILLAFRSLAQEALNDVSPMYEFQIFFIFLIIIIIIAHHNSTANTDCHEVFVLTLRLLYNLEDVFHILDLMTTWRFSRF